MKEKANLTARVLSATFWLPDLTEEMASLSARANVKQASRELETFLETALAQGATATWPDTELGRAALVLFLLGRPKTLPPFAHRRDRHKLANGSAKFKSVLKDRWRRAE